MAALEHRITPATRANTGFLTEMARHAATLERRPLPAPDSLDVTELLPGLGDLALVAHDGTGRPVGAAWCTTGPSPLVLELPDAPEVVMAVAPGDRGAGVGTALLRALTASAHGAGVPALVLNVHLRNTPAVAVYTACGFRVTGAGRGWFGVAMSHRA